MVRKAGRKECARTLLESNKYFKRKEEEVGQTGGHFENTMGRASHTILYRSDKLAAGIKKSEKTRGEEKNWTQGNHPSRFSRDSYLVWRGDSQIWGGGGTRTLLNKKQWRDYKMRKRVFRKRRQIGSRHMGKNPSRDQLPLGRGEI